MIGLAMALTKRSKIGPLNWLANSYVELLRGTPILLQIMIGFILLQRFPAGGLVPGILTIDLGRLIP